MSNLNIFSSFDEKKYLNLKILEIIIIKEPMRENIIVILRTWLSLDKSLKFVNSATVNIINNIKNKNSLQI